MSKRWFYKKINNKYIKILPLNSGENLTKIGLAFWIMDDGSYNKIKKNLILCTDSYSKKDVLFLIEILKINLVYHVVLLIIKKKERW